MKLLIYLLFFSSFISIAEAQRLCTTRQEPASTSIPGSARPGSVSNSAARDTLANEIITIPVVIHLLFNTGAQNISDAQIISQLDVLNKDFRRMNADAVNTPHAFRTNAADARIMFCLAQVDPTGRPTRGIVRKHTNKEYFLGDDGMKYSSAGGDDAWDSRRYLNIWVCNMFGRSLGYSTLPGSPADKDGVVINFDVFGTIGSLRAPFDKGRTATHEVGHWLGLQHIWGDDNCGSDGIDDTPKQSGYNFNCPVFPHVSSCSPNEFGDMFMNFMDFTDDQCMNMFTNGQKLKMRSLFSVNGQRNSFLHSFACDSSLASGAPIPDDTLVIEKPRSDVRIFPNPVQNKLTLAPVNEYSLKGKTCTIYSVTGARLLQKVLSSETESMEVSSLAPGIYILKVGEGGDKRMIRIVKI